MTILYKLPHQTTLIHIFTNKLQATAISFTKAKLSRKDPLNRFSTLRFGYSHIADIVMLVAYSW